MAAPSVAGHEHRVDAPPGAQPWGVHRPRRPRASPLYGLLDRRFRHLSLVYDRRSRAVGGPHRHRGRPRHHGGARSQHTHGSLANWHPHLHLVVTDGGFRPDGTFVRWPGWPAYDSAALSEAFRRAVLRLLVRRDRLAYIGA